VLEHRCYIRVLTRVLHTSLDTGVTCEA
jgi:hypothetical protein